MKYSEEELQEKMDFLLEEIDTFFCDYKESLKDILVSEDLIELKDVSLDLSQIYDPIEEKIIDVSLDDIVEKVINRVRNVIFTFKSDTVK